MIGGHARIGIDSAPLIYFLEDDPARAEIVDRLLKDAARGRVSIVTSVLTEAELLVRPLREGNTRGIAAIRDLLDGSASIVLMAVTREIGRQAARLRAETRMSLVDSMVASTAIESECTALLGNDESFRRLQGRIEYLHLDDLIEGKR